MESRERNSFNYNNPPQSNQDSSPRLSNVPLIASPTSNTRIINTPNHQQQQVINHYHGFKLQQQNMEPQRPSRYPNPDPDPATPTSQAPSRPPETARAATAVVVRYTKCLKNHAANMGAHVLDGCGEFMPNGEDDTPEALKCAACECHRSFHRREVEGGESQSGYHTQHTEPPPRVVAVPLPSAPAPSSQQQQNFRYHQPMPPMMMAFGGANGAPAESSSEDLNVFRTYDGVRLMAPTSKKRFRTKFTQEQKDKMQDFADRIGWKIQKQDEQQILQFCKEVGLKKQVFKVWMHNNKQGTKKKEP
ncbi:zinc-finger homeodomain protein 2-like [Rutidosis leptorrhynchoides]|uniref:zinc-finger homeodomain protein 2-like n=1 Tax=Rutidosis leptorrhynchoides TaxID=125765 RepID=UPI003A99A07C